MHYLLSDVENFILGFVFPLWRAFSFTQFVTGYFDRCGQNDAFQIQVRTVCDSQRRSFNGNTANQIEKLHPPSGEVELISTR
jgi:hypothetical protein